MRSAKAMLENSQNVTIHYLVMRPEMEACNYRSCSLPHSLRLNFFPLFICHVQISPDLHAGPPRPVPRSGNDIKFVLLSVYFCNIQTTTSLDCGSSIGLHSQVKMSAGARNERFGSMGTQGHSLDAFQQLVQGLSCYLASSPSSAFKDINHRLIIKAMENYTSQSSEWDKYAHKNEKQSFTRNLVDPGNGKHNLVCRVRA